MDERDRTGDANDHDDTEGAAFTAPESSLARRWQELDRGWQALLLGLAIVAVHLVWYAV